VTIGALSLITPDPEEQIITIFNIIEYPQFDPVTLKHDIALVEVIKIEIIVSGRISNYSVK
jgi:hypothetical protein